MGFKRKISDTAILKKISDFPQITKRELALDFGVTRQAMIYRLRRLEARGKILRLQHGLEHRYVLLVPVGDQDAQAKVLPPH